MKIKLEIISSAFLLGSKSIENLDTKALVPKMTLRRRLTRAAKIVIKLQEMVGFSQGRVICGSSYGDLGVTASILKAIKDKEDISPTDFQNSVYSTAVSYLSIISQNKNEITTLSCGDKTAISVLKVGAVKALDGDELLLLCFEAIDIPNIEELNACIDFLESGVALKVKITEKKTNLEIKKSDTRGISVSISELHHIATSSVLNPVIEIEV